MKIRENQLARNIVANLGWRWLQSRRVLKRAVLEEYGHSELKINSQYLDMCYNIENADWNAFQVSRRILYGLRP